MKVIVNILGRASREYLDDFDETTIPNIGDVVEDGYYVYIVTNKTIKNDVCVLDTKLII